ncbi:MAG: hypothetical protein IT340_04240 [Chloroflexi bacterium]|nr:hypothetical protein [Chloroflexota bacterium]
MARSAGREVWSMLAAPSGPAPRLRWAGAVLGPLLALPIAAAAAGWLAGLPPATAAWLIGLSVAAGGALGLARARSGWIGRVATWSAMGLAAGLPVAPLLTPAGAPGLVAAAAVGSALALGALVLPARLATGLAETILAERRQWWQTSLRAARLTRRTIGLGVYRQLCRTGFIRVLSAGYPGRVYLVPRRTSPSGARVLVEEHGHVIGGLCLRPRQPLPDPEEVVAHVLWLRGDERAYLAAANFFPYDTALTPQATARRL